MLASQIDALTAITDPDNSYDSRFSRVHNELGITLFKDASYKTSPNFPMNISYRTFELGVHLPAASLKLDYQRGSLDTLVHRPVCLPIRSCPTATCRRMVNGTSGFMPALPEGQTDSPRGSLRPAAPALLHAILGQCPGTHRDVVPLAAPLRDVPPRLPLEP